MPILDTSIFKERAVILGQMLSTLQDAVPQVYIGEDGILRIVFEIEAGQLENTYMAAQLLLEDVFPQTASAPALKLHGDTYNVPFLLGETAQGVLKFTGAGGTSIAIGTVAGAEQGGGADPLTYSTTEDGEIPNPGNPTAVTATVSATSGTLTGTYEYVITFLTDQGETVAGATSNAVSPSSKRVDLTVIPLGGPGTLSRRIYRQKNGTGGFLLIATISNNTATTYTDNIADGSAGPTIPPAEGTANSVELAAVATQPGTAWNVQPGTITTIVAGPSGLTDVTNPLAFDGGTNIEDIEAFRQRLLEYLRIPRTGSNVDLKFWAEQIDGVDTATVFDNDALGTPAFGHTTVRIVGPGGVTPDSSVQAAVLTWLDTKDVANITIHVGTFISTILPISVSVVTAAGYLLVDVELSVQEAVSEYVSGVPVGGTVYKSGVIDAVFGLPGIVDVNTSMVNVLTANPIEKFVTGINNVTVT